MRDTVKFFRLMVLERAGRYSLDNQQGVVSQKLMIGQD